MIRLVERATTAIAATAAVLLGGTDESAGRSGPGARMHVAVAAPGGARLRLLPAGGARSTLVVRGVSGTLEIEQLQLVAPPLLVDLPLAGGVVQVPAAAPDRTAARDRTAAHERTAAHDRAAAHERATAHDRTAAHDRVPPRARVTPHAGSRHLRLHRDDVDESDRGHIAELVALLRSTYPAFPARAHAVAHGWFTPTDGRAARPFIAYLDDGLEPRVALPARPTSLSAPPRGQAARRKAALRSLATLRAVAQSASRREDPMNAARNACTDPRTHAARNVCTDAPGNARSDARTDARTDAACSARADARTDAAWTARPNAARNVRADAVWYARSDRQQLRLIRALPMDDSALQSARS